MAEGEDEDSKQHEPSQKKLDDARKRGEVARSADLNTAISYMVLLITAIAFGPYSLTGLGQLLSQVIAGADRFSAQVFGGKAAFFSGTMLLDVGKFILPWVIFPGIAVIALNIATRSFAVSGEKLQPKLSRISIISNAKNKFGRSGLFEFFKSFAKLLIYCVILGSFLFSKTDEIIASLAFTPGMIVATLLTLCVQFFSIVLIVAFSIGGIDYLWQYSEHLRKNRMSHKELMDEIKQSEGDPHVKQQRRQKGYDIAMNQMLADVPEADVVIVNPTHYAVALKWSKLPGEAPKCVAKGVDEIAAKIRELAAENAIPIHSDPPTARALHATVNIGDEIQPEHYHAVAASIRFAEEMRQRARKGFGK